MLERQQRGVFPNGGGFQNGVINTYPHGAEFYTWDGKTCGHEGHLTYSEAFLQAVLLREPTFRNKLLRPLRSIRTEHWDTPRRTRTGAGTASSPRLSKR